MLAIIFGTFARRRIAASGGSQGSDMVAAGTDPAWIGVAATRPSRARPLRVAAVLVVLVLGCVGCGLSTSEADWCRRPENREPIVMTDSSLMEQDRIASAWDAWVREGQPPTGQLEDACHKAYESEQTWGSLPPN